GAWTSSPFFGLRRRYFGLVRSFLAGVRESARMLLTLRVEHADVDTGPISDGPFPWEGDMNSRTIQILPLAAVMFVAPATLAGTYTPIDFPGADSTEVAGISASGVMVGSYTDSSGSTHGFKLVGD